MANVDVILDNESFLIDTSGGLTGGSKIYLRSVTVVYPFDNLLEQKSRILVNPAITSADDSSEIGSNWNRRKSFTSYLGFSPLQIQLDGMIDLDSPGSFSADSQYATVGRLWQMWSTPVSMPYYFFDSKIGNDIMNDPDPTVGNPWPTGSIPVAVKDLSFEWSRDELNIVNYSLTLWEDRVTL